MNNGIFKANLNDVKNAAIQAVLAAILMGLGGLVSQQGFNLFTTNWYDVLQLVVNSAFIAFIGSITKTLLTTDSGNVLGVIKTR